MKNLMDEIWGFWYDGRGKDIVSDLEDWNSFVYMKGKWEAFSKRRMFGDIGHHVESPVMLGYTQNPCFGNITGSPKIKGWLERATEVAGGIEWKNTRASLHSKLSPEAVKYNPSSLKN